MSFVNYYDTIGMENGLKTSEEKLSFVILLVASEEQALLCTKTCTVSKFIC